MVSLFALGHLAQHCYPNGPLRLTQMGIEVAVPQLPGERKKKDVCKDLVIWPEDKMTCWNDKFDLCREPMAVSSGRQTTSRIVGTTRKIAVSTSQTFNGYEIHRTA